MQRMQKYFCKIPHSPTRSSNKDQNVLVLRIQLERHSGNVKESSAVVGSLNVSGKQKLLDIMDDKEETSKRLRTWSTWRQTTLSSSKASSYVSGPLTTVTTLGNYFDPLEKLWMYALSPLPKDSAVLVMSSLLAALTIHHSLLWDILDPIENVVNVPSEAVLESCQQ